MTVSLFPRRHRSGLTLIELMVALAVISLLAGIALPTVKNSLREQKVTRAASLLQSAIEEGRARSIASGGGGGIIIDRLGDETIEERSQSIRVRLAITPPPYAGELGKAVAKVGWSDGASASATDDVVTLWFDPSASQIVRSATDIADGSVPTLINRGDSIQIGDAGLPMSIVDMVFGTVALRNAANLLASDIPDATVDTWVMVTAERPELNLNLRRFLGQDVSFMITRSPRPAIAMPIELTKGTAIDLTASGVGRYGNEFSPMFVEGNYQTSTSNPFLTGPRDYRSIFILFGARGEVSRVFASTLVSGVPQLSDIPITGDIHLLVGQAGEIKTAPTDQLEDNDSDPLADEARDGKTPLLDFESVWVTVKVRNGEVVTSPWVDPTDDATDLIPSATPPISDAVQQSRIRTVIGRTRSSAVESRDVGSL